MFLLSNCNDEDSKIIVEIPDPAFKAYLLENFDTNKDGNISLSEAKAVKEIDCSNRNIKDLTGIEKFKNLKSLNCSNNQLDEIELRYNKKINHLVCNNNLVPLDVYFALSSPISNKKFKKYAKSAEPDEATLVDPMPINVNKCIFDAGTTRFIILFEF